MMGSPLLPILIILNIVTAVVYVVKGEMMIATGNIVAVAFCVAAYVATYRD